MKQPALKNGDLGLVSRRPYPENFLSTHSNFGWHFGQMLPTITEDLNHTADPGEEKSMFTDLL